MTDGLNRNEWFLFPFKEKVQIYSLILLFLPVKKKKKINAMPMMLSKKIEMSDNKNS